MSALQYFPLTKRIKPVESKDSMYERYKLAGGFKEKPEYIEVITKLYKFTVSLDFRKLGQGEFSKYESNTEWFYNDGIKAEGFDEFLKVVLKNDTDECLRILTSIDYKEEFKKYTDNK